MQDNCAGFPPTRNWPTPGSARRSAPKARAAKSISTASRAHGARPIAAQAMYRFCISTPTCMSTSRYASPSYRQDNRRNRAVMLISTCAGPSSAAVMRAVLSSSSAAARSALTGSSRWPSGSEWDTPLAAPRAIRAARLEPVAERVVVVHAAGQARAAADRQVKLKLIAGAPAGIGAVAVHVARRGYVGRVLPGRRGGDQRAHPGRPVREVAERPRRYRAARITAYRATCLHGHDNRRIAPAQVFPAWRVQWYVPAGLRLGDRFGRPGCPGRVGDTEAVIVPPEGAAGVEHHVIW